MKATLIEEIKTQRIELPAGRAHFVRAVLPGLQDYLSIEQVENSPAFMRTYEMTQELYVRKDLYHPHGEVKHFLIKENNIGLWDELMVIHQGCIDALVQKGLEKYRSMWLNWGIKEGQANMLREITSARVQGWNDMRKHYRKLPWWKRLFNKF